MQRYNGKCLGSTPHIVVIGSCKVGNFVVTIPLLAELRKKYPKAIIDFWGSEVTRDFEEYLCIHKYKEIGRLIDWRCSWDMQIDRKLEYFSRVFKQRGAVDYLINCDGFNPMTQVLAHLLQPQMVSGGVIESSGHRLLDWGDEPQQKILKENDWDSLEFLDKYSGFLKTQYIAELFCKIAYITPSTEEIEEIVLPSAEPDFLVPDLLIHCSSTRMAKLWDKEKWIDVMNWCLNNDITVGLVGTKPKKGSSQNLLNESEETLVKNFAGKKLDRGTFFHDLRGKTSLIELAGACKKAKAVLSVDAGPMHIATAVGCNVLVIVGNDKLGNGASPIRLWLPRGKNLARTVSNHGCTLCAELRFKNDDCVRDEKICMSGVHSNKVIEWLNKVLVS